MLDLSRMGKPKAGRPGPRRKGSEGAESDTAAILMQMAAVAEAEKGKRPAAASSARAGPSSSRGNAAASSGPLPTWQRARSRLLSDDDDVAMPDVDDDEDVVISDVDEAPVVTPRRGTRRQRVCCCPSLPTCI